MCDIKLHRFNARIYDTVIQISPYLKLTIEIMFVFIQNYHNLILYGIYEHYKCAAVLLCMKHKALFLQRVIIVFNV